VSSASYPEVTSVELGDRERDRESDDEPALALADARGSIETALIL